MKPTAPSEEEIFKRAREAPSLDARNAYLKQACGGDDALYERVEALLQAAEEEDSFLERPPGSAQATAVAAVSESPGDSIDRYNLTSASRRRSAGGVLCYLPGTTFIARMTEAGRGETWRAGICRD